MPVLYLLIGLAAGALAGLFGIGGGILIVPALVLVVGMTYKRALGTSLAALLLPVGVLAAREYWKTGNVDVRGALLIAVGMTIGAGVSAHFAQFASQLVLRRAFAVLLVMVAIRMWVKAA
jgi:uncharacterized membrane protein YfcA